MFLPFSQLIFSTTCHLQLLASTPCRLVQHSLNCYHQGSLKCFQRYGQDLFLKKTQRIIIRNCNLSMRYNWCVIKFMEHLYVSGRVVNSTKILCSRKQFLEENNIPIFMFVNLLGKNDIKSLWSIGWRKVFMCPCW